MPSPYPKRRVILAGHKVGYGVITISLLIMLVPYTASSVYCQEMHFSSPFSHYLSLYQNEYNMIDHSKKEWRCWHNTLDTPPSWCSTLYSQGSQTASTVRRECRGSLSKDKNYTDIVLEVSTGAGLIGLDSCNLERLGLTATMPARPDKQPFNE